MTKYHIVPKTGNPGKCTALIKCPFGDETEHYDSANEARAAYEAKMVENSTNVTTLDTYEKTFDAYLNGSPQEVTGGMKHFIDKSFADLPKGSKVLELGSGFGRDAQYLTDQGYEVTATDAPEVFVEELKARGFKAKKLNALTDGFPRSDAIFANAVFLHFSRDELATVIGKAGFALHGKGKLIFTVKEGDGEGWSEEKLGAPRHFTYWREAQLVKVLEDAGFNSIKVTRDESGPAQWLQVEARRPASKKRNVGVRIAPLSGSDTSPLGPSYSAFASASAETMAKARPGAVMTLGDGRRFIKSDVAAYGDNSWKVDSATHVYDNELRLEAGRTYAGGHILPAMAKHGAEIQE